MKQLFSIFRSILPLLIILIFSARPLSAGKYDQVDRHVENIPAFTDNDLLKLTHYLVSPFDQQEEKVRAIYHWITTNIDYDIVAYRNRSESVTEPAKILETRKCVCGGYANLFKKMAELAGMEAEFIPGYSKGYNYQMGKLFDEDNMHAWNAVRIDGQWRLLDATWGAGYIDDNQQFVRSVNDYYFLTPPEQFIQSHYPKDIPWQLLDRKVSRREFEESAFVKPAFFAYALETVNHEKYRIESGQFQAEDLDQLRFSQVTARLLTKDGIATIKRLHLVGPIVQAEGSGTAGLLDKNLDLHLLLQIREQYVGKITPLRDIVTKISDKHGFVQLPLTVQGTFDEPVYGLDQSWLEKTAKRVGVKQVQQPEKKQLPKQPGGEQAQKQLKEGLEKLVQ